jgi:hypothetical protein
MNNSNIKQTKDFESNGQNVVCQYGKFTDWFGRVSLALYENRLLTYFFLILFLILTFLYFPTWQGDTDMWWHFALGKYYITHHTMKVNHAIFSWTPTNPNWRYNTWLGSTIEYLIYSSFGGFGIWLFQWGVFAGIFLFFLSYIRSIQGKLDINAISLIFLIAIAEGSLLTYPKPELFTPLFFTAFLFVFFSIKRDRISSLYFFLYPMMFILWVNLHGGFIVGLITAVILFITECLNYFVVKRSALSSRALIHYSCSLVLISLACMFNPYGWSYLWDTIAVNYSMFNELVGKRNLFMSARPLNWSIWSFLFNLEPGLIQWWNAGWAMILMFLLFITITVAAIMKKRFLDLSLLFLTPLLFYYGMNTSRAGIFFPIFSFFTIYYTIEKAEIFQTVRRFSIISMALFLFFGFTVLINLRAVNSFNFFGMNLDEITPQKEIEFIRKFKLPPPLFNDYRIGGYMIWALYPEYKVFIDSRGGPYDTTQVGEDYTQIMDNPTKENLSEFNRKYPFRVALIRLAHMPAIMGFVTNTGGEWRILFFDRNAVILVHKSLLPTLDKDLSRSINLDPLNFREVKNPATLFLLFNIYVNSSSGYGEAIRGIYCRNVSNFYIYKDSQLEMMQEMINQKKQLN